MWKYGSVQEELNGDVEVFYILVCWVYWVVCYIVRVFGVTKCKVSEMLCGVSVKFAVGTV